MINPTDRAPLALPRLAFSFLLILAIAAPAWSAPGYPWIEHVEPADTLGNRIPPPAGFERIRAGVGSFAAWLRGLPLKPAGARVKLYTGADKWRQDVHAAVVDIDVGNRDLQQCADAIMRLRAEWLYAANRAGDVAFNFTGGGRVPFARWAKGERPSENGRQWSGRALADAGYGSFRRYLTQVFIYAGTYSLAQELKSVPFAELQIGDVFIQGGFPGHAVLVADLVENPATGERRFLLLQSYMPAQDIHVLRNPSDPSGSPWYPAAFTGDLVTPEWTFPAGSLKRWPRS
jgi:hypothetical protein